MEATVLKKPQVDRVKRFVSTRRGAYAVAAGAALLAALVLLIFVDRYKDNVNAGLEPAPVLTADRLIPRGTAGNEIISGELFKPTPLPKERVEAGAVTAAAALQGKVAVRDILPGEQIKATDFAVTADPIRSRLTKTERAVQIPIDRINGLLGTLRAGDRVDILAAFNSSNSATGVGTPILEPLLRDVRVMAVGGGSVILETTDRQGANLAFAADNATLWFLLRPPVGAKDSKPQSVSQESLKPFEVSATFEETENGGTVTITGREGE